MIAASGVNSATGINGGSSVLGRMLFFENSNCTGNYYDFVDARIVGPEHHGPVGPGYVIITNNTAYYEKVSHMQVHLCYL